jgi:C-terminal processing protease CtpA/Prc
MRKSSVIITLLFIFSNCFSQQPGKAGIYRIGDYGRLWSVLKLFHPEMAYNTINTDSLFTDNINELLADPSAANFKMAVQKMINRLHDPYTTIAETGNTSDSVQLPARPLLKWLDNGIAVICFDNEFIRANSEWDITRLTHLIDTLKNASGIIIDLRKKTWDDNGYYDSQFMQSLISFVADTVVPYPSFRTRIHYGHESETFSIPFYYQGWFVKNGTVVYQNPNAIHKPISLLINRLNSDINDAIAATQQAGLAKVIADDSLGNFEPTITYPLQLTDSVTVNVRLSEAVYPNGNRNFSPDTIVYRKNGETDDSLFQIATQFLRNKSKPGATSLRTIQNTFASAKVERYDSLAYPAAPLRLLGLMRYWSTIEYFCANKDRIQKNWDSVLYEYVPRFLSAKDSLDYLFAVAHLTTEIHDGHGALGGRFQSLISNAPPVQLKFAEGKTVISKIVDDSLKKNIAVGDEIIAIDNIPVNQWRDSIAQYIGASNDAALQRSVTLRLLGGKENSVVHLTLMHNNKQVVVDLKRNRNRLQVVLAPAEGPVWKKINDKTGYVDFGRLQVSQIDSMFNDLKNMDAIILDDRSYPQGTVWTLINYLTAKPVNAAKGITMIADSPDPLTVTSQEELWQLPVTPNAIQYKGKLIILVNETTQSQAEYSCMVLQAAYNDVTIVGSQTAGADGDVTGIALPGGISVAFSGHGIHYPDGRLTQGIGIVPDIKISPTVKGIKEGRDEVLERAIEFAKTGK